MASSKGSIPQKVKEQHLMGFQKVQNCRDRKKQNVEKEKRKVFG